MKNSLKGVLYLLCLVSPLWPAYSVWAGADDGVARLEHFYEQVNTLRARFQQQVFNEQQELIQEAGGSVVIKRPGRFRWDYETPYEQVIVADGERLWVYDADLEQVTVKAMDESLEQTPALLLSSDASLTDAFKIEDLGAKRGKVWVALQPRGGESNFKRIRLGFDDHGPAVMELMDSFDQITRLEFSRVELNTEIDPQVFQFQPPPGVDVIK